MVKKLFKSVHIYRSYRQNNQGVRFFGPHGTYMLRKYSHYIKSESSAKISIVITEMFKFL